MGRALRFILYSMALIGVVALLSFSSNGTTRPAEPHVPLPTYDASAFRSADAAIEAAFAIPDDLRLLEPLDLCGNLHAAWNRDWQRVIGALTLLVNQAAGCEGTESPRLLLYPAYYNYGVALERRGDLPAALEAYRRALAVQPQGREAAQALRRHNALTPPPPETCTEAEIAAAQLPLYTPYGKGDFVRLEAGRFTANGAPFVARGVNYYPARAPWRRFLTQSDLAIIARELDLLAASGVNTIRIFAWHEALFQCVGSGIVPHPEAFARLDGTIRLAAERGMRVLLTLNDLPDLIMRPLYTDSAIADAQSLFIVSRYRDEPAILAFDLRNEGDIDYVRGYARSADVIAWLNQLAPRIRAAAPNHLLTAGWNEGSLVTERATDFLSFHHWRSAGNLHERINALRAGSRKPILLQELGYPARATNPAALQEQARRLEAALQTAENANLLGWLLWTAFDFPTDATCIPLACPSADNAEHHFGLWTVDYAPKPAVQVLERFTRR
ncbi:MAG: hypothetical protein CUN51_01630 [Candidatus Thermofonsia Clade 1 bacterium]|uniref:mannan endo-1,4-beta-mannosidase n=1 Tax=Candidatus Thermofonsia Clade 1 bacterium TaxID=2364210 RepID=A0A2M8P483_9CHLR|nr:MAG: hypothetical protein CUN51_01630 [Candidatus Thermofonsia Clade 1 bacterium]